MLRSYFKIAFRNLLKNKTYSLIIIVGLAIGLSYCLLTFLYVHDEWTYDQFHQNHLNIYRVYYEGSIKRYQYDFKSANVHTALGPELKKDFAEIDNFVRLSSARGTEWDELHPYFKIGDKTVRETFLMADPSFFTLFSFNLQIGDKNLVLQDKHSIVISQTMAQKYFRDVNPIGQTIGIRSPSRHQWQDFKVTGVLQSFPQNSSIQVDFILSFENMEFFYYQSPDWKRMQCNTYISLVKDTDIASFEQKMLSVVQAHTSNMITPEDRLSIKLQPLANIHSNTSIENSIFHGATPPTSPLYSHVLASLCFIILLIACINFINLLLGRVSTRIKEIGIRKVIGAGRNGIMNQFLVESLIITLLALSISFVFTYYMLPYFNNFTGKELSFNQSSFSIFPFATGLVIVIGLLAGCYPAILLSNYHPIKSLRFMLKIGGKNNLRHGLMLAQFCFTIILIAISLIMTNQINHIQDEKTIGFNKESLIVIDTDEMPEIHRDGSPNYDKKLFVDKLKNHTNILYVGTTRYYHSFWKHPSLVNHQDMGEFKIRKIFIDHEFVNTFQLQLIKGRDFSEWLDNLNTGSMIVSESFVRKMKWDHPIGKQFFFDRDNWLGLEETNGTATVIGVVNDFHFLSLKDEVYPTILLLNPSIGYESKLCVAKIATQDVSETIKFIEKTWKEVNPGLTFRYSFFDQDIANYYRNELYWFKLISFTSFFAIFITCLGLFGIISLVVNNRTKEIGIRKICGATVPTLWALLSKDYVKLVLVSNFIAWPIAWYVMNKWLQNFAYRIDLTIWPFLLSALLALLIALLTVSWQAIRAARANPVKSLRYE